MDELPYKFTFVRQLDQGFHLESADDGVWPRFGEVYLRVEPLDRGHGVDFVHLPRAHADHTDARLPSWAVEHVEMGALHALFIGGPGGIQITDLRVMLLNGRHRPTESGERAFFLAGYLAMRQAIHRAVRECPCFLEYVERASFLASPERAGPIKRELVRRRASGIHVIQRPPDGVAGMVRIEADVPMALRHGLDGMLARLDPMAGDARLSWEPVGYRSRELRDVPELLNRFGPPLDWPEPGDDVPRLGQPFPALPVALNADLALADPPVRL